MKILIFSLSCCTYCVLASGQSLRAGRSTTGSAEQDLHSHDDHKKPSQQETTMKGCLLGQDGKYILITSKQSSVLQLVATPNLGVHAGHTVKITGTVEEATASVSDTAHRAEEEAGGSTHTDIPASGHLRVRKIKTISQTCQSNSDKKKKGWIRILDL